MTRRAYGVLGATLAVALIGMAIRIVQRARTTSDSQRGVILSGQGGLPLSSLFEGLRPHPVLTLKQIRSDAASRANDRPPVTACPAESQLVAYMKKVFSGRVFAQTGCQGSGCAGQYWVQARMDCVPPSCSGSYDYATNSPPGAINGGFFPRTANNCVPSGCQPTQCEHVACDTCFGAPPCPNGDTDCTGNNFCFGICCEPLSPVLLDIEGNGFAMTSAEDGIEFDFAGDGVQRQISWTAAGSDDGWLALDRNRNGSIDSSLELFGNRTAQVDKPGVERNGFEALAAFDDPISGGNGDGRIDRSDRVFQKLLIWQDRNHNGVSEGEELKPLLSQGITSISLAYLESKRVDEHGNEFRFAAKVEMTLPSVKSGDWAYDVYLRRREVQSRRR